MEKYFETYGLDGNAPVASVNDLVGLMDELREMWGETFERARTEPDWSKASPLYGQLCGIEKTMFVLSRFNSKMARRMPRK